ncbi:hypothetical protein [Amnibacterium kyonggiense]|uniref:Protein involved in plasmid replication-relaxation n=1 Tax=Amnibacterium kyonggiense TaxID=595671 RepID=A0A4R7FR95_9MICO|nr:hypothetical protein [Amnibacterium kyonggiense]TDS80327.1 hypothetical protein CLV52_0884 [Amnibacterium kyonggiense]
MGDVGWTVDRDARTVWVVPRDEQMMTWFQVVRIANVQSVRWVLGALNSQQSPVSVRRAQAWCARLETAGLVGRAQLGGAGGSLVWGTYAGTGVGKPSLYRQTTRHEVAVSAASARYAAAGCAWRRDEKPAFVGGHQADGVALGPGWVELIEVELTPKRLPRYVSIFRAFRRRLDLGEANSITYLCNTESARAVREALTSIPIGRTLVDRVSVHEVYDLAGQWISDALPDWLKSTASRGRW